MSQKLFTKNFVLLIFGQASSLFGNLILRFALSMYVLEVTGSATIFAGILAIATIPTILLSPLGGILADRANRRNIMVALDTLTGILILFATLLFSKSNGITVISVLLTLLSILGAFETPTVQACIPQMQTGDNITRGNAIVNQIASIATLIAPLLGSILYVTFGLNPVMIISIICFFLTAILECFIKLEYTPYDDQNKIFNIIKNDFSLSMKFMHKEQRGIFKILLLTAGARFFVIGTIMVGFPYIVRNVLGLSAEYYGAAESTLAIATIVGSIFAGLLTAKLRIYKLSFIFAAIGAFLVPAGVVFLFPTDAIARYIATVVSFCGVQIAATIFSIFAVSIIQQKTPNHLIGKIMAYTYTITLCIQPLGQITYGLLFDNFSDISHLILIPTGLIVCMMGILAKGFFRNLEVEQKVLKETHNAPPYE